MPKAAFTLGPAASRTPSSIIFPGPVIALFAGLEHEHDVSGQGVPVTMEEFEGTDQSGRVQVVTAGVHPPRGGCEVEACRLRHGQSVHVSAQQHSGDDAGRILSALATAEDDDEGGESIALRHLDVEAFDGVEDEFLGDGQIKPDLGVLMQCTTQSDKSVCDVRGILGGGEVDVEGGRLN